MRKEVLFVVLAVFVLVLTALACGDGGREDIKATVGARPTATEMQAAPTPIPAPTLVPLPAREEYLWAVVLLLDESVDNAEAFIELGTAASDDYSLFVDETWRRDMVAVLAAYLQWGRDIRALDPPEEYLRVHAALLDVAKHIDNFVLYYTSALETLDPDEAEVALIELELATEAMHRVNTELGIVAAMEANKGVDG